MDQATIFNVGAELRGPDGVVYTLSRPTQYQQGEFQRWLEQRAHDAIDRGTESEAKKDKRHDRVYTDSALGKYEWEGPLALEAMWTPAGLAQILLIVCRAQVGTIERAEEILQHAMKEVAAKILIRATDDPKALRETLAGLGLPTDWTEFGASGCSSSSSSTPPSTAGSTNSPDSPTTSSSSCTPSSAAPMG